MNRRDMALVSIIALTVAGVWYGWRYYNNEAVNQAIGFSQYTYEAKIDSAGGVNNVDWSLYEPLSFETP